MYKTAQTMRASRHDDKRRFQIDLRKAAEDSQKASWSDAVTRLAKVAEEFFAG